MTSFSCSVCPQSSEKELKSVRAKTNDLPPRVCVCTSVTETGICMLSPVGLTITKRLRISVI